MRKAGGNHTAAAAISTTAMITSVTQSLASGFNTMSATTVNNSTASNLASVRISRLMATTAGLAPPVAAEVERFVHAWHAEVRRLATVAQESHDAFVYVRGTYEITDLRQAERIRSLLPWAERHDAIRKA